MYINNNIARVCVWVSVVCVLQRKNPVAYFLCDVNVFKINHMISKKIFEVVELHVVLFILVWNTLCYLDLINYLILIRGIKLLSVKNKNVHNYLNVGFWQSSARVPLSRRR